VHDGVFFEDNGMPTATVISTEFAKAARAQASALGEQERVEAVVGTHQRCRGDRLHGATGRDGH